MKLWSTSFKKENLLPYITDMSQICPVRSYTFTDGMARGMRVIEVDTGSGFRFTVLPDRSMGISHASFNGKTIGWMSPTLETHPAHYKNKGDDLLETFYGGLLTMGGLMSIGKASMDGDEHLGLHGRISALAANDVQIHRTWKGEHYIIKLSGWMREAKLYQPTLTLHRTIQCQAGSSTLRIQDTLTNMSYRRSPWMLLYHFNFGFPLLSPESILQIDHEDMEPLDEVAQHDITSWNIIQEPQLKYQQRCYLHRLRDQGDGYGCLTLFNPSLEGGFGIQMRVKLDTLPILTQWKNLMAGEYVMGLEPSNVPLEPRGESRTKGRLTYLEPWEERSMEIELSIVTSV